ncbi:hypothetical protein B0H14DRAFT_2572383 [Mycena olivaceomarginata]|nr:hypothetical protein B0H14DRAFT_2572383 [Mycena olivaceomarginata]
MAHNARSSFDRGLLIIASFWEFLSSTRVNAESIISLNYACLPTSLATVTRKRQTATLPASPSETCAFILRRLEPGNVSIYSRLHVHFLPAQHALGMLYSQCDAMNPRTVIHGNLPPNWRQLDSTVTSKEIGLIKDILSNLGQLGGNAGKLPWEAFPDGQAIQRLTITSISPLENLSGTQAQAQHKSRVKQATPDMKARPVALNASKVDVEFDGPKTPCPQIVSAGASGGTVTPGKILTPVQIAASELFCAKALENQVNWSNIRYDISVRGRSRRDGRRAFV